MPGNREEGELNCPRAGVAVEHLQEVVISKMRTEDAQESNRGGTVWRKQNTHRSRDKRVCDVFGELQVLVDVVGTKRTKAGPG